MTIAVIQFPGSNCDHDAVRAVRLATGGEAELVWHQVDTLDGYDAVLLPGGFSYGDYLRCGAIARLSPIMAAVTEAAGRGVPVLGICNGFQILTEAGLLPGALRRNSGLRFTCRHVDVVVERTASPWMSGYEVGDVLSLPVAHAEGNYTVDDATLEQLEGNGQVVLRYAAGANPNGSTADIAGVSDMTGRIVGMMPHPERATDALLGSTDGRALFASVVAAGLEATHA